MKCIQIISPEQANQVVIHPEKIAFYVCNYSGEIHVDIQHKDAEVYIFGLYIGKGNDRFNIKTVQKHSVGNNISDLFIKSVLYDASALTYEGLISIKKGAQLSNAYQKNQNLLLSKNAFVDSRPFLEIQANDVRCTHGSTTGRLNKDQLFYVESRGLSSEDAQKVLVEGYIMEVFQRMNELSIDTEKFEKQLKSLL